MSMESSHLVIFSTSGTFITKFNIMFYIASVSSKILFWTGARGLIPGNLTTYGTTGSYQLHVVSSPTHLFFKPHPFYKSI